MDALPRLSESVASAALVLFGAEIVTLVIGSVVFSSTFVAPADAERDALSPAYAISSDEVAFGIESESAESSNTSEYSSEVEEIPPDSVCTLSSTALAVSIAAADVVLL